VDVIRGYEKLLAIIESWLRANLLQDTSNFTQNYYLSLFSYEVTCNRRRKVAANYQEAVAKLNVYSYDVILLDIMLPDGNGLDVLHFLKEEQSEAGILIISAKNSLDDKVQGLELGADDYLTKPFHLSELNARLKAIYRRRKFQGFTEIKFNEISVDLSINTSKTYGRKLMPPADKIILKPFTA